MMRIQIALATALLLTVATPVQADGGTEPFDVGDAREVGFAAKTNGINGINVSPVNGTLYAASVGGDEITVHDANSGKILDRIGPERGVTGPDDVFITPDGTIYWTEILTGYVGVLKPDGTFTKQLVGEFGGPNPITVSDDGRVFVGLLFFGAGLYELDPDLVAPPRLINPTLSLNSFDIGADGFLYAPSFFTGEVLKIDVDSGVTEVVASGFATLPAAKFNSLGELHIAEGGNGTVWKLDLVGGNHELLMDIEGTIDNIAFDAKDRLFVAAGIDNQILRRTCTDGRVKSCRVKALSRPGLGSPGGVAVSPDGTVWVAEFFAMRGYESNRRHWDTSFYDRGSAPGTGFAGASTVAADGDDLVLTFGFANSVQVMDPATGEIKLDVRNLALPTNAIRHGDKIVAGQLGTGTVVNAEDPSEVFAELAVPLGLASDGDTLYVADWALGIVLAVDDGGAALVADGLHFPEGIALDGDRLLVVETGRKQVTAIDLATGEKSAAVTGLDYSARVPDKFFPYGFVSGVAVGPNGSIYVSDDGVNKVYEFRHNN